MTIYLPLSTQKLISCYFYIIFVISSILNVIGLIFLLKQTPPNQAIIRNHLIAIQLLLLLSDVHLEIGYHPIALYPEFAMYATGVFVHLGLSVIAGFAIAVALYVWIGMMIFNCIMYRHQTILPEENMFKMKNNTLRLIQFLLIVVPTFIPVSFAFSGSDQETMERYLIENEHNLTWIKSRGFYHIDKRTPHIIRLFSGVIFCLAVGSFAFVGIFIHMFYVLRKDSGRRSFQAAQNIRKSLVVLFCQLVVPILLYVLPTITLFLGLRFENLITFEVCLRTLLVLPLHSIVHNVILLAITPTYRNIILPGLKRIFDRPVAPF